MRKPSVSVACQQYTVFLLFFVLQRACNFLSRIGCHQILLTCDFGSRCLFHTIAIGFRERITYEIQNTSSLAVARANNPSYWNHHHLDVTPDYWVAISLRGFKRLIFFLFSSCFVSTYQLSIGDWNCMNARQLHQTFTIQKPRFSVFW